jgi:hypothetical protein
MIVAHYALPNDALGEPAPLKFVCPSDRPIERRSKSAERVAAGTVRLTSADARIAKRAPFQWRSHLAKAIHWRCYGGLENDVSLQDCTGSPLTAVRVDFGDVLSGYGIS